MKISFPYIKANLYICRMKKFHLIGILLLSLLHSQAQQKYALIVAISDYPSESGWSTINSTNDLDLLQPEFERLGFHTTILSDQEATKKNILKALTHLTKQIQSNNEVCLHFSCHGQQMEDTNEDETDGLDEALIPFDANLTYKKGIYEGKNHLCDDELESHLNVIRKKLGPNGSLIVTLDACHSGTATREEEFVEDDDAPTRGSALIFSANPFYIIPDCKQVVREAKYKSEPTLSPITVISACQPFQRNYEIKVNGSYYGTLSYAFYEVLKTLNTWDAHCHHDIIRQVRKLSSKQIPMIETTNTR